MSDPNDSMVLSTIEDSRALLSPIFLEFCTKVRNNDLSVLPAPGEPLRTRDMSERERLELADALLENTNVTYLKLEMLHYTKCSAEAMAKYIRTSKSLQRIHWDGEREEIVCCFLHALQESTSLKQLHMGYPFIDGSSNLMALENILTHTQSLRSLSLMYPGDLLDGRAAIRSGLKKNTTLRELTLNLSTGAMTPILTNLCDHPHLRKLCLVAYMVDLTGLETLLLSETSKITELYISVERSPIIGLTSVLHALARRPTLTKLELSCCNLGRDEARLLRLALCNIPSLQSLVLTYGTLAAGLTELAPALYRNTSIKVLDISKNNLIDMQSAEILRDILRHNKTMTALNLSANFFGRIVGAVECITEGMGGNSTLLKIDLSSCEMGDRGVSILAQNLGSRNTTLQKLTLYENDITSTGVGVLLETMKKNNNSITDLDLQLNPYWELGSNSPSQVFGKQRAAKPHTPLSF
jgi:hypothetical protein